MLTAWGIGTLAVGSAPLLEALGTWISQTGFSLAVRDMPAILPLFGPTLLVVHLLGVAVVASAALILGGRLLSVAGTSVSTRVIVDWLTPWIWGALSLATATGVTVFCNRPLRYLHNPVFQLKMLLIIAAVIATGTVQAKFGGRVATAGPVAAKLFGGGLFALWLAAVFAGRWIPYAN